jgi:hypothetical protein
MDGEIRDFANCKNKKDDWCVFLSPEFQNGVKECSTKECARDCAYVVPIL